MTIVITLTTAGTDTGPFWLFSDVDGFATAFDGPISRADMVAGYSTTVPLGTTIVKVQSTGNCFNFINIPTGPASCYKLLPDDNVNTYPIYFSATPTKTLVYGHFTSYQNGIPVVNSNTLIKLNPNLTHDASLNPGLGVNQNLYYGGVALEQPDGKIICTGTFTSYNGTTKNRIVRLLANGTIDPGFTIGTGFNNFTQGACLTVSGQIYVTGIYGQYDGVSANRLIRLNADGTRDNAFVVGAGFVSTSLDVMENADGSVWVMHYHCSWKGVFSGNGLAKILPNGNIDPSYVPVGVCNIPPSVTPGGGFYPFVANDPRYMTRIPGETSFYVTGYFTHYNAVAHGHIIKLTVNGLVDGSFNGGVGFNAAPYFTTLIWNNKLLIIGEFTTYKGAPAMGLIVLNADGSVLYSPGVVEYFTPIPIGNTLYGKPQGGCLIPLYNFVPATTTTTTTCANFNYQASVYICGTCTLTGGGTFINNNELTLGKYYYSPVFGGSIILLNSLIQCTGSPGYDILDSSQQNTCAAVVCPPPTTTTTTTCIRPAGLVQGMLLYRFRPVIGSACGNPIYDIQATPDVLAACAMWTPFKQCVCVSGWTIIGWYNIEYASLAIGQKVYENYGLTTCNVMPSGHYYFVNSNVTTAANIVSILCVQPTVVMVTIGSGGIVTGIDNCS